MNSDPKILLYLLCVILIVYIFTSHEKFGVINLNSHLTKTDLQNKIEDLQTKLYNSSLDTQKITTALINCQQQQKQSVSTPTNLPFRQYTNMRSEAFDTFKQLGFLFNDNDRFPLYGRQMYPGRSDRFEYFIIDESRNKLRIPFKSKNNEELLSGNTIYIQVLNDTFNIEIYDYDNFRYNPNVLI
jgi:predicted PurR-regulated permease PerM